MTNTHRTTLASFLTYFVMSAMLAPIGIISGPMAEYFGQPITEVTRQFGWLTSGILIGSIAALFIFDWVSLKRVLILVYLTIAAVLFALMVIESLEIARYVLGTVGIGCGIGLAAAAVTISRTYNDNHRASMLVITDGCFSFAGFTTAWLATWLIGQNLGWSSTYQLLALVAVTIMVLAALSSFPEIEQDRGSEVTASPWPIPVWLCVISLFLYTLGQNSMLFWLPTYAMTWLAATPEQAGALVGQFWLGMFFAQIFVAWWVLKIGIRRLVMIGAVTTCLFSVPMWTYPDIGGLTILALVWGFFNLAMLKAILSLATLIVSVPSARLVSLMLLGATTGTAISPLVTSQIVEWTDARTILMFGTACYATLGCLMYLARALESDHEEIASEPA
jgi:TsgA-like MFS transporter